MATAYQIKFIDLIIEHLTERVTMDSGLLYASPFIDIAPQGPGKAFDMSRAEPIVQIISDFNRVKAA